MTWVLAESLQQIETCLRGQNSGGTSLYNNSSHEMYQALEKQQQWLLRFTQGPTLNFVSNELLNMAIDFERAQNFRQSKDQCKVFAVPSTKDAESSVDDRSDRSPTAFCLQTIHKLYDEIPTRAPTVQWWQGELDIGFVDSSVESKAESLTTSDIPDRLYPVAKPPLPLLLERRRSSGPQSKASAMDSSELAALGLAGPRAPSRLIGYCFNHLGLEFSPGKIHIIYIYLIPRLFQAFACSPPGVLAPSRACSSAMPWRCSWSSTTL
jgi:hypothetical protein